MDLTLNNLSINNQSNFVADIYFNKKPITKILPGKSYELDTSFGNIITIKTDRYQVTITTDSLLMFMATTLIITNSISEKGIVTKSGKINIGDAGQFQNIYVGPGPTFAAGNPIRLVHDLHIYNKPFNGPNQQIPTKPKYDKNLNEYEQKMNNSLNWALVILIIIFVMSVIYFVITIFSTKNGN